MKEKLNITIVKGSLETAWDMEMNTRYRRVMVSINGHDNIFMMTEVGHHFTITKKAVRKIRAILKHDRESGHDPQG